MQLAWHSFTPGPTPTQNPEEQSAPEVHESPVAPEPVVQDGASFSKRCRRKLVLGCWLPWAATIRSAIVAASSRVECLMEGILYFLLVMSLVGLVKHWCSLVLML